MDREHILLTQAKSVQTMKRALTIRNVAKGAGTVVVALIAIDLIATVITIAVGAEFLKR
jgi:hypothetical protein